MENATDQYLDDVILSQASHRQLKVAMLHVRVWDKCKAEDRIVSNEKFDERLRHLVDQGKLEAFGDITNWRFSEVLRAQDPTNRKSVDQSALLRLHLFHERCWIVTELPHDPAARRTG